MWRSLLTYLLIAAVATSVNACRWIWMAQFIGRLASRLDSRLGLVAVPVAVRVAVPVAVPVAMPAHLGDPPRHALPHAQLERLGSPPVERRERRAAVERTARHRDEAALSLGFEAHLGEDVG